ncbi:hypothetical protein Goari_016833 [Gossypium aridum]|uniref:Uncharacterized protein n=1 Tax=Gossypium aridum TaxID=34290 RepID=A0A7J8WK88_GOSAI|nr:hypothetical protein [Gossypium aridum]
MLIIFGLENEMRCKSIYTEYPSKCLFITDFDG